LIQIRSKCHPLIHIRCRKKFVAFFPLDGIKCSATTNRIRNTRRAFKKWHFNFCFEPKKIEIDEVDQKYFILKMEINKEKIRYILQYHYDKDKKLHRLVKKFALFTMKILYQNQQHGNDSLAFVLEISMWKMNFAPVDQSLKNPMKSW